MELSPEDSLRLNVLLANRPQAIRINESRMVVYGLSEDGEAQVQLNPNGRDEQYIKRVKELLSGHVLGSPGGYPVYLQRWTRMGQMKDGSLEQLLLLGEPEAVVAAVCAPGLTDELARRAWWAMEDAENARQMLHKQAVVEGQVGPALAAYLIEHLPFEAEAEQQIETVRLVLQPGLVSDDQCRELWRKAQRKPAYYVGFLASRPDDMPEASAAHPELSDYQDALSELSQANNAAAGIVLRVLSSSGQAFIETVFKVFKKPSNQDVVTITLDQLAAYFSTLRAEEGVDLTLDELQAEATEWMQNDAMALEIAELSAQLADKLRVMRILSGLSYGVVRPAFKGTTAIGSLMRKKLQPVLEPLLAEVMQLRS